MKKQRLSRFVFSAVVILLGLSAGLINGALAAPGSTSGKFPTFEPDPVFPKLPNGWVLGNVAKVVVDRHDNVWIIHRPRTVPAGKMPAPPVLEFDAAGKFLQAWGGDGPGYDWPDAEHNVFVDYKDNVWISGSSPGGQSKTQRSDDMLLKFSNTGKFLMEIGGRSVSLGSKDPKSVNKPGDIFVSAKTNEVYVADGYGNRRVVVFDAAAQAVARRHRPSIRKGRARRGLRAPCTASLCRTITSCTSRTVVTGACRCSPPRESTWDNSS
ncbi:MAG: hypothetical protein ABSA96_17270 [Candidatus Acidiferrales bacterium]